MINRSTIPLDLISDKDIVFNMEMDEKTMKERFDKMIKNMKSKKIKRK